MDVRVEPKALLNELGLSLSIVESKATIPILANLLLKAEGTTLEIAATDLEVTLRTRCSAEVLSPGGVTVAAKKFVPMVRGFQGIDTPLSLKATPDQKLFLQPVGGKEEYHLHTLPEEDYPSLMERAGEAEVKLEIASFRRAVSEILISVGQEDTRYSVRGAQILLDKDRVTLVSTDSHRLTLSAYPADTKLEDPVRALIPRKTLVELMKLEEQGEIGFTIQDNHVFLECGHRVLYSRLMDSTFPAYERVIPSDTDKAAVVERIGFLEKLRRVSTVTHLKTKMVTLSFDPAGTVEILARNPETGDEGKEYLPCEQYEGEKILAAFNVDYLLDFLSVADTEKVVLKMKGPDSQVLLEPMREDSEAVLSYVIMPLRLD